MENKNWDYTKIGKKAMALMLLFLMPMLATPWSTTTSAGVDYALPAVAQSTVFFGQNDGKIIGLDYSTGTQSLSILTAGGIYGNASLDGNNVYIGSTDGILYSIDAVMKTIRWVFSAKSNINGSAAVATINSTKYIFVTSTDGYLYCLNESTGSEIWSYNLNSLSWSAPVIHNGIVYVGAYNGNIYAIDATSTGSTNTPALKWEYQTGASIRGTAAISGSALYVGNDSGKLTAVDLATSSISASVKWDYTGSGSINSAPVVDVNGLYVYFNCYNGYTYCINTGNGSLNWHALEGIGGYGSPVIYGMNLIADSTDGYLKVMSRLVGWDQNAQSINVGSMGNTPIVNNGEIIAKIQSGSISKLSNTLSSMVVPVVETVNPSRIQYNQQNTISVTGTGFFGGNSTSDVVYIELDDTAATRITTFSVVSDSSITGIVIPCTVNIGTYNLKVTNNSGTNAASTTKLTVKQNVATASFVKMDSQTQGTWRDIYGTDGYMLYGYESNLTNLPSYVSSLTISGTWDGWWHQYTDDVKALQRPVGEIRIGFLKFTPTAGGTATIDLNMSDGITHQIALYSLDHDNSGRTARIDVVEADSDIVLESRTMSSYSSGVYTVFRIKGPHLSGK